MTQLAGCTTLMSCLGVEGDGTLDGFVKPSDFSRLKGFETVFLWSSNEDLKHTRLALAKRNGALIPLVSEIVISDWCQIERHVCIDTTASGGNASLLAQDVG
jgi:RHH-type proline utilization regulon transcriptional repressor/proline dehydrogenase/delta 1-pyrroline-5-carboxylate dehydrogenase